MNTSLKSKDLIKFFDQYIVDIKNGRTYPSSEFLNLILDPTRYELPSLLSDLNAALNEAAFESFQLSQKLDEFIREKSLIDYINTPLYLKSKKLLYSLIYKYWFSFKFFSNLTPREASIFVDKLNKMKSKLPVAKDEIEHLIEMNMTLKLDSKDRKSEKAFIEYIKQEVWNDSKKMFREHSKMASVLLRILFLDHAGRGLSSSSLSQTALRKGTPVKKK